MKCGKTWEEYIIKKCLKLHEKGIFKNFWWWKYYVLFIIKTHIYVCMYMRVRVSMHVYSIRYGYQIYLKQLNITNLIIMAK